MTVLQVLALVTLSIVLCVHPVFPGRVEERSWWLNRDIYDDHENVGNEYNYNRYLKHYFDNDNSDLLRRPEMLMVKRGSEGSALSLSVTNNMDVLRSKLLRELMHRRHSNLRQGWATRNKELLEDLGK